MIEAPCHRFVGLGHLPEGGARRRGAHLRGRYPVLIGAQAIARRLLGRVRTLGSVDAAIAFNRSLLKLGYELWIRSRAEERPTVPCQFSETDGIAHLALLP